MEPRGLERDILGAMKRFGRIQFCDIHRGFTNSEFMVMVTLECYAEQHDGEGMRAAQLAERVDASPQALSRTLRALEEKGLIERQADPSDRRHTYIRLTGQARENMRAGQQRMQHMFDQVIAQMGEEEIRTMVSLVNRMTDIMQSVQEQLAGIPLSETEDVLQK